VQPFGREFVSRRLYAKTGDAGCHASASVALLSVDFFVLSFSAKRPPRRDIRGTALHVSPAHHHSRRYGRCEGAGYARHT